jgi:signal transduction histidine kinase
MLSIISVFQYRREHHFRTEQLDKQLTTYNFIINNYINEQNPTWDELQQYVSLFPESSIRVTVIDKAGNVIYDSSINEGSPTTNHLTRPEIVMSQTSEFGKYIRHSYSTGIDYYYVAHHFKNRYVRSALPYNVNLATMLKANTSFIYFMLVVFIFAVGALYLISKNFYESIDRLRVFTQKAETEDFLETNIEFPQDELGEISRNIVRIYKLLLQTKDEVIREREKLIMHLQISQEGLGIFSSDKKEILANTHFIQYTNILSDQQCESSDQIFSIPEFADITNFIDQSFLNNELTRKRILIEKGGRVFSVQCIVFQDNTFEISINDISVQEHENELKRHLTQNISHELKTPVSSIMGYMESILENPNLDEERQRFFIERSFLQAQRLTALLQDISTLNKMDEAKRLFEKEKCNISEVILDVLNDVNLQIEQREFEIHTNFGHEIFINGNRSLLYSIFRNLLDNALAHAGERITIDINCYREDERFYYFSFTDNGSGVAQEHLNRLFERFYRVDRGRSRKLGGTGLGLAIVKNAIFYHHGTISAKNVPTGGLSFVFSLCKH